jgi:hypothetical protein
VEHRSPGAGAAALELAGKLAPGLFGWLRVLDRLVGSEFAVDAAGVHFFLGRRAEVELQPREIVGAAALGSLRVEGADKSSTIRRTG